MAKDKKVKAVEAPKTKIDSVKNGRVAKPVDKHAAKDVAKKAAKAVEKESKKSKKVKEPTPVSESDSESEDEDDENTSQSSDSSDADSSDEEMADVKPATNGSAKAAVAADSDDSEDDSEDSEDSDRSEAEAAGSKVPKANGTGDAAADSDSDESEDDDDEEADDDSDSDSSDDDEDEEVPATKEVSKKRKADDSVASSAKKTKYMVDGEEKEAVANLFVGQLSWNVDDDWLTRHFEEGGYGTIISARVITDRDSGRSKGFGYVEFSTADEAGKALEALQGSDLDGRNIRIDFSTPRADKGTPQQKSFDRAKKFGDAPKEPSSTLWIGNLPFDIDQSTLGEYFQEHGSVSGVRLPTDRETGELKGFGYVEMASVEEATAAYEALQGADVNGRPMRLDYAGARPERQDSFGGGRGGGGRGGFSRGGRGGGRGRGNDRGGRGGRGGRGNFSTNRGGFGDFSGQKKTF